MCFEILGSYIGPGGRARTPCLTPLGKGFPLLLSQHVEDVSNERQTFQPRGEWSASPGLAEKTVQGEEGERGKNEICKEKDERHRVNKTTGRGRIRREKGYLCILETVPCSV